ncbi:cytochrome c oxidase subunit 3 [Nocardia sp. NEAU-351]|uniref:Cytochrome aa3 subunit 3 n=2 Tax=Nocardia bovistercoris TaxID=2785916 RepID=A0A931N3H8_9NOCA|nr:cytochrome c oxidase subunit 3 [Nocardia bovistercoris]MBH0777874.1 cytochrome c oxidase subunit 3 [Nocardia bovistercoris]
MWVMILGDLFFFGCYFVTYMVFRARSPERFSAAQQHLHIGIGVTNTVVLLTSSMFVALAVIAVRESEIRRARRLILAGAACGVLFTALKAYEWHREISAGFTVSDEFFGFYYVLTGVHLAHVLLGLLILGIALRDLRDTRRQRIGLMEQAASFWHMVDLLWVVIFAIVYLMR